MTLSRARSDWSASQQRQRQSGHRVVIYGAGDAAGLVIREIVGAGGDVRISGFIDDDPRKVGIRVMGYPVLGGYSALTILVNAASVDAVVISARSLPPERMNNLETLCSEHNVKLSRLRVALESLVDSDAPRDEKRSVPTRHLRSDHAGDSPAFTHRRFTRTNSGWLPALDDT